MSFETHLASLEEKHLALENELATLMSRPRPEEELIVDLKRKKLQLKDRMKSLREKSN